MKKDKINANVVSCNVMFYNFRSFFGLAKTFQEVKQL